jgi:hypothetical protein
MLGLTDPPRRDLPPLERMSAEYRTTRLLLYQKSLNLCRESIKSNEALGDERAQARLKELRQFEQNYLKWIKELGGQPDATVGKLTIHDLPTPQELQEDIRKSYLKNVHRGLDGIRASIKRIEAMEDNERKTENLNWLRKREAWYLQQLEELDRGSIRPVMPVIPRTPPKVRD